MDVSEIPSLIASMSSEEDGLRKMAVFRLQSSISDPALADAFISDGGLSALRSLILTSTGNTLAYSLQSFSKILEVDMGWEVFEAAGAGELVERIVELIVQHPLVNILRGAMSICAAVVGHPYSSRYSGQSKPGAFGLRAIKPAVVKYPQFYDMVVQQLDSADHALCGNAISLLNALMRDVLTNGEVGGETDNDKVEEWTTFIKRFEDLGVMAKACELMRSSGLQDLAHPLLETQIIALMIIRKRQDIPFDIENPAHRRLLKVIHASSKPTTFSHQPTLTAHSMTSSASQPSDPQKWRRLGFLTEHPSSELSTPGSHAALRDLNHYVVDHSSTFQRILLEQSSAPLDQRAPIARCSMDVSWLLYDHFRRTIPEDNSLYRVLDSDTPSRFDTIFKPLLLEYARLHIACLSAFIRLLNTTQASHSDYDKIMELVRILIHNIIGGAQRTDTIQEVEERIASISLQQLRDLQMKAVNDAFEAKWSSHLSSIRAKLRGEATEFMREQRIRCLVAGAWFPLSKDVCDGTQITVYRYARLSVNRRFLHYCDFAEQRVVPIKVTDLPEKIRIDTISSVLGVGLIGTQTQVETKPIANGTPADVDGANDSDGSSGAESTSTIQPTLTRRSTARTAPQSRRRTGTASKSVANLRGANVKAALGVKVEDMRITIRTLDSSNTERVLLTLTCPSQELGCEWLDGLLMLLGMEPKTEETKRLIDGIVDYGLKIRLLNVRIDDDEGGGKRAGTPSREGVDDEYYYAVG